MVGLFIRRGIKVAWIAGVLAAVSVHAQGHAQMEPGELSAEISLSSGVISAGEAVDLTVTLTNDTSRPVKLLDWHTPFEGFKHDMLDVRWRNQKVRYEGRLVKRAPAGLDDVISLEPGESITTTVDLAQAYDLSVSGDYYIRLDTDLPPLSADQMRLLDLVPTGVPRRLLSNGVGFRIVGGRIERRILEPVLPQPSLGTPPDPTFTDCSPEEIACINAGLAAARAEATQCKAYLNDLPVEDRPTDPNYMTWYGAYTMACYATVLQNWCSIADALNMQQLEFICGGDLCEDGDFAYVFPNDPYKIYLCNGFFNADVDEGKDTKMGTLIHEISHFTAVAGTDDHAYGTQACMDLAMNNPAQAKDNADTYEYFAECKVTAAVPALPLPMLALFGAAIALAGYRVLSRRAA